MGEQLSAHFGQLQIVEIEQGRDPDLDQCLGQRHDAAELYDRDRRAEAAAGRRQRSQRVAAALDHVAEPILRRGVGRLRAAQHRRAPTAPAERAAQVVSGRFDTAGGLGQVADAHREQDVAVGPIRRGRGTGERGHWHGREP